MASSSERPHFRVIRVLSGATKDEFGVCMSTPAPRTRSRKTAAARTDSTGPVRGRTGRNHPDGWRHQAAAKRLYISLGFEVFAQESRALKIGDVYVDEDYMVLHLRPGASLP